MYIILSAGAGELVAIVEAAGGFRDAGLAKRQPHLAAEAATAALGGLLLAAQHAEQLAAAEPTPPVGGANFRPQGPRAQGAERAGHAQPRLGHPLRVQRLQLAQSEPAHAAPRHAHAEFEPQQQRCFSLELLFLL